MNRICLGEFELLPSERMLLSGGSRLELGARAFDLLLVLAENPGRLVSKAELIEHVWPSVIVDENNLPAQIANLRRVLGAEAIRTVPGFGYRLELPVTTDDAPDLRKAAAPRQEPLVAPRRACPVQLAPLVGREQELVDLHAALGCTRLVTLVGMGGVGKTRLAQEILTEEAGRPGGAVAWVPLGAVKDVQHVPSAIALALVILDPSWDRARDRDLYGAGRERHARGGELSFGAPANVIIANSSFKRSHHPKNTALFIVG